MLVLIVVAFFASPASAQLSLLQMEDMRLLYFEATQGYLAPHVARCFINSLELQKELWGWEPSEPVTVILVDLSDRGNASASVAVTTREWYAAGVGLVRLEREETSTSPFLKNGRQTWTLLDYGN